MHSARELSKSFMFMCLLNYKKITSYDEISIAVLKKRVIALQLFVMGSKEMWLLYLQRWWTNFAWCISLFVAVLCSDDNPSGQVVPCYRLWYTSATLCPATWCIVTDCCDPTAMMCPAGLEYNPCGPPSRKTCASLGRDGQPHQCHVTSYVEGCHCPEDKVQNGRSNLRTSYHDFIRQLSNSFRNLKIKKPIIRQWTVICLKLFLNYKLK